MVVQSGGDREDAIVDEVGMEMDKNDWKLLGRIDQKLDNVVEKLDHHLDDHKKTNHLLQRVWMLFGGSVALSGSGVYTLIRYVFG